MPNDKALKAKSAQDKEVPLAEIGKAHEAKKVKSLVE